MKANKKLDELFAKAREQKDFFTETETSRMIDAYTRTRGANLSSNKSGVRSMGMVVTSLASLAAAGFLLLNTSNTTDPYQKKSPSGDNREKKRVVSRNTTTVAIPEEGGEDPDTLTEHKTTDDISDRANVPGRDQEVSPRGGITEDHFGKSAFQAAGRQLPVEGANIIYLNEKELAGLGIIRNGDTFEFTAFADLAPSKVTLGAGGKYAVSMNGGDEKTASVMPRFVSDATGNRKISLLQSGMAAMLSMEDGDLQDAGRNSHIRDILQKIDVVKSVQGLENFDMEINVSSDSEFPAQGETSVMQMGSETTDATNTVMKKKFVFAKKFSMDTLISEPQWEENQNTNGADQRELVINSIKNIVIDGKGKSINAEALAEEIKASLLSKKIIIKDLKSDNDENMGDMSIDINKLTDHADATVITEELGADAPVDINRLLPVAVKLDGKTEYILWFEPTPQVVAKLPESVRSLLDPEIAAADAGTYCDGRPGENTYMDIWKGCTEDIKNMSVYPNPTRGDLNIAFEVEKEKNYSIAVHDLSGRKVKELAAPKSMTKGMRTEAVNLGGVEPGMYYIVLQSEDGTRTIQRVIAE